MIEILDEDRAAFALYRAEYQALVERLDSDDENGDGQQDIDELALRHIAHHRVTVQQNTVALATNATNDALKQIERLRALTDAWMETTAQQIRNVDFYRGIITQIGDIFGVAARTSDDGSIQDDVLALKVPELVRDLYNNYWTGK